MRLTKQNLILTAALSTWLTTAAMAQDAPTATTGATSHDFGAVKEGTVVAHAFSVSRPASGASVGRVELSQRGMTARVKAGKRGDEVAVTITWDTTIFDGTVEGEAIVYWIDPSQPPARLTLRGSVTPVIAVEPFAAAFFSVYQDEGGERTVKIANRDDRPLEITRLEAVGTHFTAEVRTLVPGQVYALVVRVPKGTRLGRFQEGLVVHTNQPTRPELPIGVNVLVKPDLYASPEIVDFGQVNLDQLRQMPAFRDALTQTVGIRRRQGAFVITSASSDVPGLDLTLSPARPAETFRMDIALDPARVERGVFRGTIRLGTSDPKFPEIEVPVRGDVR